ncbi:MAG: type II secretion system F family protein [Bacteroidales bacterium]|nr:type II secretion system F family protein [Bacteroidales bacterium]
MAIDLKKIQHATQKGEQTGKREGINLAFLNKEISFSKTRLNDKKRVKFYNQLGVLTGSGIDLGSALQIVVEDEKAEKTKAIYQKIFDQVLRGKSFSEAVESSGEFSRYEFYSIKVGEESGRLQEILTELHNYYELKVQQRRQISGALSYPMIVLFVAIAIVYFMLRVVIPMFSGIFNRFGGEMPALTRKVLTISNWFSDNIFFLLIFIVGLILLLIYLKRYTWYQDYSSRLIMRIPFVGKLISKLVHARFCHSLSLLTLSQVPLIEALSMVKEMIRFYPMQVAITNIQESIRQGKSIYTGMKDQKFLDRSMVSLTKIGEEVNQIGPLYMKLYKQYTEEIKHMTSVLGNLLEPILILFVGIVVMIILISMYLPLFQMSGVVG